jgi:hypothetical protein
MFCFLGCFGFLCIGATCTGFVTTSAGGASCHAQAGAGNQAGDAQASQQLLQLLFVHINLLFKVNKN